MKGKREITIGDKKIPVVFDWGAVEDFCEEQGVSFADFEKAINKPKQMRSLIWHMARSAGSDVAFDELRRMSFNQMTVVTDLINEAMPEGKGQAKPKR